MTHDWNKYLQRLFTRTARIALTMSAGVTLTGTSAFAQPACSSGDPLNAVTLVQILHAVPWDSVCDGGCNTFTIDSTVRIVATPGIVPHREAVYHRITRMERTRVTLRGQEVQWGDIDARPHHDTTLVALALLQRPPAPERNTFLIVVLPPRSFGHWVTVKLTCDEVGWTAVYQGDFEG